ncbi:hypothetical protein [Salana multivorans]
MARRRLALTSLPGFDRDVYALPDLRTRRMALDMLVLIRDGKVRGEPLGEHVKTGDLSDCYKLYFDPDGSGKPRFRLVYRYSPDELHGDRARSRCRGAAQWARGLPARRRSARPAPGRGVAGAARAATDRGLGRSCLEPGPAAHAPPGGRSPGGA